MLVLTRKVGETIYIGKAGDVLKSPIKITVLDKERGQVRLGIAADKEIGIVREELLERDDPRNTTPITQED